MWGERRGRWLSSHWQMAPQRRNIFSSCRRQPSWLMGQFKHPNVITLHGVLLERDPVSELIPAACIHHMDTHYCIFKP